MNRGTNGPATMSGEQGAVIINDALPHVITASLIEFSADAVITLLEVNSVAVDVKATYILAPANAVGGGGITPLASLDHKNFTRITLSAGTCVAIV